MGERHSRLGGGPPTIGFVVDWLEDSYQSTVLRGAYDAARARGAKLLCFAGGVLDAPERGGAQRNHIYDLAGVGSVDAAIVMSGTIGNYAGYDRLVAFCQRFRAVPLCSIALELPEIPSVVVDNDVGMQKAISHLIRLHGARRIAFVRGPEVNGEAERRFGVYRAVLDEHQIPFDGALVAPGDFQPQSGRDAIRLWFDERELGPSDIDAIVASNDSMALGALHALQERGMRVPEDIALIGFDDVEDVRYTSPPLSSVRQPLYEQGKEAVRLVLAELQGRRDESLVVLHTDLVARRSCRCFEQGTRASWAPVASTSRSTFEAAVVERRQVILAELARAGRGAFSAAGSGWELRLLNAFTAQLAGEKADAFIEAYDDVLHRLQHAGADVTICHDVISAMRRQMMACLSGDPARGAEAEDLFQEVRLMTGNIIVRAQARERLRVERWARALSQAGAGLIASFDVEHLGDAIAKDFPRLGIRSCALVRYESNSVHARLVLAYDRGKLLPLAPEQRLFPVEAVIPPDLQSRQDASFIVLPLFFHEERLGYVLLELGDNAGFAYEALRELFSAAVKGALLVAEIAAAREEQAVARKAARAQELALAELKALLEGACAAVAPGDLSVGEALKRALELTTTLLGELERVGETGSGSARPP
jgi:DNA-binding LacI/PurR family transcriptional regulator